MYVKMPSAKCMQYYSGLNICDGVLLAHVWQVAWARQYHILSSLISPLCIQMVPSRYVPGPLYTAYIRGYGLYRMGLITDPFLWSSKSFTLPQPANHFFIKLNLLRVINTEISHACCSLCWKTYNTALNCRYCPLIVKLLPILLSQMTCRMLLGCSRCTLNFVCFTYLCFATTSTAENSTIQGRLKPSHKRLLRVNVSSHRHMT